MVAAALVRARQDVGLWINLYGDERQSDERSFVADLSEALDIKVVSVPHAKGRLYEADFEAISSGFRPGLGGLDVHHDRDWAQRFRKAGAEAVMTGRGGDSILIQGTASDVYVDLWRTDRWRSVFGGSLGDLAALSEQSIWTLIRRALSRREARPAKSSVIGQPYDGRSVPTWIRDGADLGPAKINQIAGLLDGIGRQAPSFQTKSVEVLTPLLALPVVETCLSLPPAQLFRGPRDRGLARMAFRERLPASILDRQTKGEMSAIYGRHIADNLSILRPWLLNGRLAAEGIIDRRLADTVLSHEHLIWQGTYADIMTAAAIEGWVRVWEARLGPHRRQGFLPAS